MATTTKDEMPSQEVPAKTGVEKEIRERYNKGENYYTIARAVYGFDSDEAIERVRQVLGYEVSPDQYVGE